MLIIVVL